MERRDFIKTIDSWHLTNTQCPECGNRLAHNGRIYKCPNCEWRGNVDN